VHVAIVGAGLAGLAAAVDLVDAGHIVDLYEARPFMGGKVGSWEDPDGNHIEMGLHVFFFNYANLFALLRKVGALDNLLPKQHTHLFVNRGGDLRALDFRFPIGAPFNGLKAFFTTPQLDWIDKLRNALALGTSPIVRGLVDYEGAMRVIRDLDRISFEQWFLSHGGSEQSIRRMWNPIAYALGFIDCQAISARCMLTIFMMFASKTEASKLNLLKGSPHRWLTGPILAYIEQRGGRLHLRHRVSTVHYEDGPDAETRISGLTLGTPDGDIRVQADAYLAACDVPGIQRLIPEAWRRWPQFDNLYRLEAVPVATVQLRYDGWVTELGDSTEAASRRSDIAQPAGLDNLLYTADADFSCFADLALASPVDYRREGLGSLLQCVLTPGDPWIPRRSEEIVAHTDRQVRELFPSARNLTLVWSNVVKLAQSLYREAPGMEPFRPEQRTPVANFFLAGSYTRQDYIDSMEGATMSGRLAAAAILDRPVELASNPASAVAALAHGA
jgi:zeta-carotene desaturase